MTAPGLIILVSWGGVRLRPLISLLYQPRMIDDDERGAVGGMSIGRGNRSTLRKLAPVPLCPPQIPRDLTWVRNRTAHCGKPATTCLSYGTTWAELLLAFPQFHVLICECRWS
jgi:hypothetical protein